MLQKCFTKIVYTCFLLLRDTFIQFINTIQALKTVLKNVNPTGNTGHGCYWSKVQVVLVLLYFTIMIPYYQKIYQNNPNILCVAYSSDISQTKPAIYRTWFSGTPSVNKTGANKEKCNAKYLNRTQKAQVWDILVNQEMLCFVLMLWSPASPAQGHDWGGWSMVLLLLGWHLQSAGI